MPSVDLVGLARASQFDALESAWLEALTQNVPVPAFLEAADALRGTAAEDRAGPLLGLLAESLDQKGAAAELLRVVNSALAHGGDEPALRSLAKRALERTHAADPMFARWMSLSGVDGAFPLAEALRRFHTLRRFIPGAAVHHPRGWGVGVVEAVREATGELEVRFAGGDRRTFPLVSALEFLDPLDPDDLRAMRILRPDALRTLVRERPAEAIRRIVRIRDGRASVTQIKQDLIGTAMTESEWAAWWRRARMEAARASDISVEGTNAKPVFGLRERPLSLADEGVVAVAAADSLAAAVEAARRFLADADEASRAPILDALAARAAAHADSDPPAGRFLAAFVLERHDRAAAPPSIEIVRGILQGGSGAVASFLGSLDGDRERRWGLDALRDASPGSWTESLRAALPLLGWDAAESAIESLLREGRGEDALAAFKMLLGAATRGPGALAAFLRLAEKGGLDGAGPIPGPADRLWGILSLCEYLATTRRASRENAALLKKFVSFLTDNRGAIIRRLCDSLDRAAARDAVAVVERTNEFPVDLAAYVRASLLKRFPEFVVREERPWWEESWLFSTKAGIERQREAHRVLVQVKIPENSRQIGEAASHGDLSENAEWDAAIRNRAFLTQRARELAEDLAQVRPIEDQSIPDGVVVPGVRATLAEAGSGAERTIVLLGPWDQEGKDVISYRAPLGKALLGRRVGEEVEADLPEGRARFVIRSAKRAF